MSALAAIGKNAATVMIWNYHDNNDLNVPNSPIEIELKGLPAKKVVINHYRIDQQFSNSYTTWMKMGSPQQPTASQFIELEKAGQLQLYSSPSWEKVKDGRILIKLDLPRQGVSFLQIQFK